MKRDKITEGLCSIVLCIILFFNLFVLNIFSNKYILCAFLVLYYFVCRALIKPMKIQSKDKNKITMLMLGSAIIYIVILYVLGIYEGFYRNSIVFSIKEIFFRILPVSIVIIAIELIRTIFVSGKNKLSTVIMTVSLVLVDILMNLNLYKTWNLETILTLVGYVGISSISTNLLCNYVSKRYGYIPNIIYRIITVMYMYVLPIIPDVYLFFQTVLRIIYPYIIYLMLDYAFATDDFKVALKNQKTNAITLIIGMTICISIVLLISCKFKYGVMVVGSSSMTGSINKGDAIIFEQYTFQELKEGQVIVFNKDNVKTIHRIDDIQILNGETIYYTKGDNNQQKDDGYRVTQDIVGIVRGKLIYAGWPTIWINDFFGKK